ncbi:MAG: EAL domain-containing protein, partial [Hydrogenobacter sp.]
HYELYHQVVSSAVLVFAQKGEDLLELLLDMDKEILKGFRYLLKDVDDNTKIDAFYLIREVPNTVS